MRKKKKTLLARARLMIIIPRDLYYQTSGVFGICMALMLLALAFPAAIYSHHGKPAIAAPMQVSPLVIKAHMQSGTHKTIV